MVVSGNILDYFANTHTPCLHANGSLATDLLIEFLDCQPEEKILEIGFGTGSTIANLAGLYRTSEFHGVDVSAAMYKKASERIILCGLRERVHLSLMNKGDQLSFNTNCFDRIYVESVLAIMDNEDLSQTISEIRRVLKPNGVLVFNETIWLDDVDRERIQEINFQCLDHFGIIQSSDNPAYREEWKEKFTSAGFELIDVRGLNDQIPYDKRVLPLKLSLLSKGFSAYGKIKGIISPEMRREKRAFDEAMKTILSDNKPLMEGMIFKMVNSKVD